MKDSLSACKDLVSVSLVSHIPDDPVLWCVENIVQSDGKFNHAQTGPKMTGIGRNDINDKLSEFPG
jgi:hypothetical protein